MPRRRFNNNPNVFEECATADGRALQEYNGTTYTIIRVSNDARLFARQRTLEIPILPKPYEFMCPFAHDPIPMSEGHHAIAVVEHCSFCFFARLAGATVQPHTHRLFLHSPKIA